MDINKLMQQAQAMQKELEKATDQINAMEFEGSASNGLVKVTVNGANEILSVNIDPEILNPDDKEMVEDLVMIAVNDALEKVDELKQDKFGSMASAMGIPTRK
ncbi:MAG: YbaB/EbfC family nucleoid-associated protein [Erysipelotrichaceae bacterium]|nr:YbaB/EbfC family nucleoid-associated protein [Erysipelotrichaceae bacterium]